MTEQLNITSVDPQTGNPDESDELVQINGRVPGVGDSPWLYENGELTTEGTVALDQAKAAPSNGTSDHISIEPVHDALREGYLVGQAPGENVVIDPTVYANDAAAIQQCHDVLADQISDPNRNGIVWIPALRPDGTEFIVDQTVTFDYQGGTYYGIYPRGWGFFGREHPALRLDIDDGSPAFEVRNVNGEGGWLGGFNVTGHSDTTGMDCEFLRLHNVDAMFYNLIGVRGIGGSQQNGAITFDAGSYNSYVNNCRFNTDKVDCSGGSFFAFRDLEDTEEAPGEIQFGCGNSTYGDPDAPYGHAFHLGKAENYVDNIPGDIHIRGRYESYGRHAIYGTGGGHIYLDDGLELGRPEYSGSWEDDSVSGNSYDWQGTCRVFYTGHRIYISAGVRMASDGSPDARDDNGNLLATDPTPAAYIDVNRGRIGPYQLSDDTRAVLEIPTDGGSAAHSIQVPRAENWEQPVRYPKMRKQLSYPDGWRTYETGTATVSPGGTTRLYANVPNDVQIRISHNVVGDPGEEVYCQSTIGNTGDGSGSSGTAVLIDRTADHTGADPSAGYDVDWEMELRGN